MMANEPTSALLPVELLPCPNPWCNSHRTSDCELRAAEKPILMPSRVSFERAVACPVCPIQTPWFDTEAEAIAAWNTRATPTDPEVAALVERALTWLRSRTRPDKFVSDEPGSIRLSRVPCKTSLEIADLITRLSAKLQEADHG